MSRPVPFVGVLTATWPGLPGQPMVAQIALPRDLYDAFHRGIGFPGWPKGPNIALLACDRPAHPATDADVHTLAAVRAINARFAAGDLRLSPELRHELDVLAAAIGATGYARRRDLTRPPAVEQP